MPDRSNGMERAGIIVLAIVVAAATIASYELAVLVHNTINQHDEDDR